MRLLTLKTILAATDLDEGSLAALTTARGLADAAGAALHVVHVSDEKRDIEALRSTLMKTGETPDGASLHVVHGEPADAINVVSHAIGADAILVGPHRKRRESEGERPLGSTALLLVTRASVPCLVVPVSLAIPVRRVLVAVDLSLRARGTLVVALSWASALRVHDTDASETTVLTALHVQGSTSANDTASARRALDKMLSRLRQDAGTWAGALIESAVTDNGNVAAGIVDYARTHRADMVVLGTRGLETDNDRLGSVALAVTQQLDMPVLLVPPAVWITGASRTVSG